MAFDDVDDFDVLWWPSIVFMISMIQLLWRCWWFWRLWWFLD